MDDTIHSTTVNKVRPKPRKMASLALRLVVGIAITALLVWQADFSQLLATLSRLDPSWLAMSFAVQLLAKVVWALRWSVLLEIFHLRVSFLRLVKGTFVGIFFSNFLPTSIGGDLYRSYWILDDKQLYPKSIFIVFVERLIGIISLAYVAFPPFLWLLSQGLQSPDIGLLILLTLALLCTSVLALHPTVFDFFNRLLSKRIDWLSKNRRQISEALHILHRAGAARWRVVLLSVAVHLVGIMFFYCIGRALHLPMSLWHYFVIVPLTVVVTVLPISFNGLGVREGALVVLTGAFAAGTSPSEAIALGLLSSAVGTFVSLFGAVFYISGEREEAYATP